MTPQFIRNMILNYLNLMDKEYAYEGGVIKVKEKVGDVSFTVYIKFSGKWVQVFAVGPSISDLDKETKLKVLEKLLELNATTFEVKYSVQDDTIIMSAESNIYALTFDNFYLEYGSVPFGYKQLIAEVLPIMSKQKTEEQGSESNNQQ